MQESTDYGIALMRSKRGRMTFVARRLQLSLGAVQNWERVPLEHVFQVAKALKVKPELLRPEFFANDPLRRARRTYVTKASKLQESLTAEHGTIWLDRETYYSNALAALAISGIVHQEVTVQQLIKRFGKSGRSKTKRSRYAIAVLTRQSLAAAQSAAAAPSPGVAPVFPKPQDGRVDLRSG